MQNYFENSNQIILKTQPIFTNYRSMLFHDSKLNTAIRFYAM